MAVATGLIGQSSSPSRTDAFVSRLDDSGPDQKDQENPGFAGVRRKNSTSKDISLAGFGLGLRKTAEFMSSAQSLMS